MPTSGSGKELISDVGYIAHLLSNLFKVNRTLTIFNGIHSRGVYGAVRCLTDVKVREENENYLAKNFPRTSSPCCCGFRLWQTRLCHLTLKIPPHDSMSGSRLRELATRMTALAGKPRRHSRRPQLPGCVEDFARKSFGPKEATATTTPGSYGWTVAILAGLVRLVGFSKSRYVDIWYGLANLVLRQADWPICRSRPIVGRLSVRRET